MIRNTFFTLLVIAPTCGIMHASDAKSEKVQQTQTASGQKAPVSLTARQKIKLDYALAGIVSNDMRKDCLDLAIAQERLRALAEAEEAAEKLKTDSKS